MRITQKGWGAIVATIYFIFLGVEIWILASLGLSVAPGRFNMDSWAIALIITIQSLTVLVFILLNRRYG